MDADILINIIMKVLSLITQLSVSFIFFNCTVYSQFSYVSLSLLFIEIFDYILFNFIKEDRKSEESQKVRILHNYV